LGVRRSSTVIDRSTITSDKDKEKEKEGLREAVDKKEKEDDKVFEPLILVIKHADFSPEEVRRFFSFFPYCPCGSSLPLYPELCDCERSRQV